MGMCHLFPERKECYVKLKTNWVINLDQKMKKSVLNVHPHDWCGFIHWWSKPNRNGLQANNTTIWIATNVFTGKIPFWIFTVHHLCEYTDALDCDGNSFWICLMLSHFSFLALSCLLSRLYNTFFLLSLKQLANIVSL